jgi:hypothetical protein
MSSGGCNVFRREVADVTKNDVSVWHDGAVYVPVSPTSQSLRLFPSVLH